MEGPNYSYVSRLLLGSVTSCVGADRKRFNVLLGRKTLDLALCAQRPNTGNSSQRHELRAQLLEFFPLLLRKLPDAGSVLTRPEGGWWAKDRALAVRQPAFLQVLEIVRVVVHRGPGHGVWAVLVECGVPRSAGGSPRPGNGAAVDKARPPSVQRAYYSRFWC